MEVTNVAHKQRNHQSNNTSVEPFGPWCLCCL